MKGIADGAAAAGAEVHGRKVDLVDVVTLNSAIDLDSMRGALPLTPSAVTGKPFSAEDEMALPDRLHKCSSLTATGPATASGRPVFFQIFLWDGYTGLHFNVVLDVVPARGRRFVMQTFPGGIHSGTDFYMNDANTRPIIMQGSSLFATFKNVTSYPWAPAEAPEYRIVYGVDPDTNLRMPFNRADYLIVNANIPKRCAPSTGILEKAVVNQNGGGFNFLPLLDCVADMQVIFRLDMNGDSMIGTITNADGSYVISSEGSDTAHVQSALQNAAGLRDHLKEMRVYVLAHEGQKDFHYAYPDKEINS